MAGDVKVLSQDDDEEIRALLVGRRITAAEMRDFRESVDGWERSDHSWGAPVQGRLTLDDGTRLLVAPNDGCGGCTAGDYFLTSLAACDNVITAVRSTAVPHPEHPDDEDAYSYRIYVYAGNTKINAVQVDGDDGNGYYGTGYELIVIPA